LATAEIVKDMSATVMGNAALISGDAIQGSTLEYGSTPNSLRSPSPVFFAPQRDALANYWGVLIGGALRSFFALVSGNSAATLATPVVERNSIAWDRLSLELMRIAGLKADWDGEGAERVPQMAVKNAGVLLFLARAAVLQSISLQWPVPSIIPAVDGGVILKWVTATKELKCTVRNDFVEVVRWKSPDRYESDGFWEVPIQGVTEHFQWLLQ
jgi:hypothetical protein